MIRLSLLVTLYLNKSKCYVLYNFIVSVHIVVMKTFIITRPMPPFGE